MLIKDLYLLFLECNAVCTDTRNIEPNSMFFALKGPNFNANSFAQQALEKGSNYAVIDDDKYYLDKRTILVEDSLKTLQDLSRYHRDQLDIPIIGITGSNGKTTSKELIQAVLSEKYNVSATKGNLNNHIGVPLSLLNITKETEIAIIEMGANHAGEIEFLCEFSMPTLGLLTNIGKAHLEGFGDLETIVETKTALYRSIKKSKGLVFVNSNDKRLMAESENIPRILYPDSKGISTKAISNSSPFLAFDTYIEGQNRGRIDTKLIGSYNLDNALAAICIGHYFDVDFTQIKHALESYSPSNNRSQWMETANNNLILDAYNANPSSTILALNNFHELGIENKFIILGDMLELGEDELKEHQKIVDLLIEQQQEALLVGPIYMACKRNDKIIGFSSTIEASDYLSREKPQGKTILIKGSRGLKLEKLVEKL